MLSPSCAALRSAQRYPHALQDQWRGDLVRLSWSPRAFLLKDFLSDEECEHLIELAQPHLTTSRVVDRKTGKSVPSAVRTSQGAFLARKQDDVVSAIEKRVSQVRRNVRLHRNHCASAAACPAACHLFDRVCCYREMHLAACGCLALASGMHTAPPAQAPPGMAYAPCHEERRAHAGDNGARGESGRHADPALRRRPAVPAALGLPQ